MYPRLEDFLSPEGFRRGAAAGEVDFSVRRRLVEEVTRMLVGAHENLVAGELDARALNRCRIALFPRRETMPSRDFRDWLSGLPQNIVVPQVLRGNRVDEVIKRLYDDAWTGRDGGLTYEVARPHTEHDVRLVEEVGPEVHLVCATCNLRLAATARPR